MGGVGQVRFRLPQKCEHPLSAGRTLDTARQRAWGFLIIVRRREEEIRREESEASHGGEDRSVVSQGTHGNAATHCVRGRFRVSANSYSFSHALTG